MNRDDLELQCELIGLLVVCNQLKKETIPSLRILHEAQIKTVMVTGDNLQTAVTVAKECVMIDPAKRLFQVEASLVAGSTQATKHLQVFYKDPLASPEFINRSKEMLFDVHSSSYCFILDGPTFECLRIHDPCLLETVVHRAKVFARMAPEDKLHLIEVLQKIGHQVAMVGDGCNDCGALRTADAGISLSMADASVAAPFTSQVTNISCVAPLIREGRATLSGAFGTFLLACAMNFMMFIGLLIIYSISSEPSDSQFVVWDVAITAVPYFTIGNVSPLHYLHPQRPIRHVWAFLPIFSFVSFLFWQTLVLLVGWFYCLGQPWFEEFHFVSGKMPPNPCYQETTMYHLLCIGTITSAVVFAPGPPYSRSVFTNRLFAVWSVAITILVLCLMFIDDAALEHWMNFKNPPHMEYHLVILMLGLAGAIICYTWEKFFIRGFLYQWLWPRLNMIRSPRHSYQKIETKLMAQPDWPEMSQPIISEAFRTGYDDEHDKETRSKIPLFKAGPVEVNVRTRGLTVNGPKLLADSAHECIAMAEWVADSKEKGSPGLFPPPPTEEELLLPLPRLGMGDASPILTAAGPVQQSVNAG